MTRLRRLISRIARKLPGLSHAARTLDETRAKCDRLRQERDRLRERERDLRAEIDRLNGEVAELRREEPTEAITRPSFVALLAKSKRQDEIARSQGHRAPIWRYNPKPAGYELARRLSVPPPTIMWTGEDLAAPDLSTLPDRFVLKPASAASSRGVFPLVRTGPTTFRSLLAGHRLSDGSLLTRGRALSFEELRATVRGLVGRGEVSAEQVIEEFIHRRDDPDELPYDWKLYCFHGNVELVLQKDPRGTRDHRAARFRFYDRGFRDLGAIRHHDRVDAALPPPDDPDALVAAAERISAALNHPFVRVDLFEGSGGVRFGEITPHPGGDQWYGADMDRILGRAWEDAEVRLRRAASSA
jgi:hypothetical protein